MGAADKPRDGVDEHEHMQESHHDHGSHQHDHGSHHHDEPISQEEALRSLLTLGQVALDAGDWESAFEAYASALKLEQDETALYNLGSLYARGLGVRRDYAEAARLFHGAELLGNERAGRLCAKCMYDYLSEGSSDRTSAELYAAMAVFVTRVYPEASEHRQEAGNGLFAVASTHLNKGEYHEAAVAFRAAAEYADNGYAQYYLAMLYNAGAGLPKNDLAALYWLDRAVDNGAANVALADRDGMLGTYQKSLSDEEFCKVMATLADWCEQGTPDVPVDYGRAVRWREMSGR